MHLSAYGACFSEHLRSVYNLGVPPIKHADVDL